MSTKRKPPRYDEVFRKGTAWLNSLAAAPPDKDCLYGKDYPCFPNDPTVPLCMACESRYRAEAGECLFAIQGGYPCDLSYPDAKMFCKNCARLDIALSCGVPPAWVPENHRDLTEDELVAAIERARDAAL